MLECLIIGGGIHGTHLLHRLIARKVFPREGVRVLDPHPALLARWEECTRNVGMEFLRSPIVHHLGVHPHDLWSFSRAKEGEALARFAPPYQQPSLALFQAHARALIARHDLNALLIRGMAERLSLLPDEVRVETSAESRVSNPTERELLLSARRLDRKAREGGVPFGTSTRFATGNAAGQSAPQVARPSDYLLDSPRELRARRVVLAVSGMDTPRWPDWAERLRERGGPVYHIFAPGFSRASMGSWSRAVVVGGGMSAVQAAFVLAAEHPANEVILLSRHKLRIHQFDADAGWLGPKYMDDFWEERDYTRRRALIQQARFPGSVPREIARSFEDAAARGRLSLRVAQTTGAALSSEGRVCLTLDDKSTLLADRVLLATGFVPRRPGGLLLDDAIHRHALPCAPCGYPILDEGLRWHPRLWVAGPLAELELGPTARNIAGARNAAQRIACSIS